MQAKQGKPVLVVPTEGFDLRTHYFDNKTKRLSHVNAYRMHVIDGVQFFERPVGSCNVFYKSNEPAGVIDLSKMKVDIKAEHQEWAAPLTAEQKEQFEVKALITRSAELERELAALKKESELKTAATQVGVKNGNGIKNTSGTKSNVSGNSSST